MPRCGTCPINVECNKTGKVKILLKGTTGKDEVRQVCPILYAVQIATFITKSKEEKKIETVKQSEDNALQTKEG